MIADPESLVSELRSLPGIKDVDIVQFPSGKELWVVLRDPVNFQKLRRASSALGYTVARMGAFPSRLPRSLAEMIWDGVMYLIRKESHSYGRMKPSVGHGPVAKIVKNLATGDSVYHVNESDGLKILQEYLKS